MIECAGGIKVTRSRPASGLFSCDPLPLFSIPVLCVSSAESDTNTAALPSQRRVETLPVGEEVKEHFRENVVYLMLSLLTGYLAKANIYSEILSRTKNRKVCTLP